MLRWTERGPGSISVSVGNGSGDSDVDIVVRIKPDEPGLRPDEPVRARPLLQLQKGAKVSVSIRTNFVRLSENRMMAFALAVGELLRFAAKANEAGLELHASLSGSFRPMTNHETDAPDAMLHDETEARAYFEAQRRPDGKPICPRCGSANVHRIKGRSRRRGQIICNTCLQIFTVTVGTVMERSHVPLNKWALALHMMAEKGISAKQLQRELKLGSYRTARFMCSRIREGMKRASLMGRPINGSGNTDVASRAPRPGTPRAPFGSRTPACER